MINEEKLFKRSSDFTKQDRKIYLKEFRKGFSQTLNGVKVVDSKGNDVTPKRKGNA